MTPKSAVTASNMATILRPSTNDLTVEVPTQSKEFREKLNFEILMMILCNTLHRAGTEPAQAGPRLGQRRFTLAPGLDRNPIQADNLPSAAFEVCK
jgi:hypothetical protein